MALIAEGTRAFVSRPRPAAGRDLPRLLVVTHYPPGAMHGGAVCVQHMLDGYPQDCLVWLHHAEYAGDPASPWSSVRQRAVPLPHCMNRFGLRRLRGYVHWLFDAQTVAKEAEAWARSQGVEAVLALAPGIGAWSGYHIAQRLGVPLHLWVHDDPAAYLAWRGGSRPLQWYVQRCFRRAYVGAAVRFTISEPMRQRYFRWTGCDAVVLPPSLGPAGGTSRRPAVSRRSDRLRIGFAGSLYCPREWRVFLEAMETLMIRGDLDRPEIVVFAAIEGSAVPPRLRDCVRVAGWQPAGTVDRELASMDFLYMPVDFAPSRRVVVETSFSTKFVSYLRLGVPILCHAPAGSAVADFVRRHPVGPLLDTSDIAALADRLRTVFRDTSWNERVAVARPAAMAEFDHARLLRRFHESLRSVPCPRE